MGDTNRVNSVYNNNNFCFNPRDLYYRGRKNTTTTNNNTNIYLLSVVVYWLVYESFVGIEYPLAYPKRSGVPVSPSPRRTAELRWLCCSYNSSSVLIFVDIAMMIDDPGSDAIWGTRTLYRWTNEYAECSESTMTTEPNRCKTVPIR